MVKFNSFLKIIATISTIVTAQTSYSSISSTFDLNDESWLVVGDSVSAEPTYLASGGNPGGYLSADDSVAGGTWYWLAPSKFLGNQGAAFAQNFTFELAQSTNTNPFANSDIIFIGSSLQLHFDTSPNPEVNSFTPYSVNLSETSDWRIDSLAGTAATNAQIQEVLGDLTAIRIRGEFQSGADTGWLDNVVLNAIPESSNYTLIFGVLASAILTARRKLS